jgi:glycosyltransferase involved in cell wall biosynthesis
VQIAMVTGRADPGRDGVADYTAHLVRALRATGADVDPVPVDGSPRSVVATARRIRATRPDVVHVQFAPSAFGFRPWPGLLPDLVRAPVVTTVHEYGWWAAPSRVPGPVWRAVERTGRFDRETWRLVPAAAAAVTTNAGHAGVLERRLGVTAELVPLAPNVPDLGGVHRPAVRRELGVPDDAEVVAFFGFVHPVKGLRYLIEAVAALRATGRRRLHLLVLGGFTSLALPEPEAMAFRAELEALVREHGVGGQVTITGRLPAERVSAALHAADIAAFPFTAGATTKSGALLSAFAHRLPTLVTAADPPDPALVDGATVVVAPRVRDAGVLVDGLRALLDDPDLRARVAAGGAALGAERTWPRIAEAHRELYDRVRHRAGVRGGARA